MKRFLDRTGISDTMALTLAVGGALTLNSRAAARTSPEGVNPLTQIKDENQVTVEVTPLNTTGSGSTLDFRVALHTHSGNLNYDLTKVQSFVARSAWSRSSPPAPRWASLSPPPTSCGR